MAVQDAYGRWYRVHLSMVGPAVTLLLIGFFIPLAANRPYPKGLHHYQLGIAVFIMAMLQPFSAIPRYMTHHVRPMPMLTTNEYDPSPVMSMPSTCVLCSGLSLSYNMSRSISWYMHAVEGLAVASGMFAQCDLLAGHCMPFSSSFPSAQSTSCNLPAASSQLLDPGALRQTMLVLACSGRKYESCQFVPYNGLHMNYCNIGGSRIFQSSTLDTHILP